MSSTKSVSRRTKRRLVLVAVISIILAGAHFYLHGQDRSGFPDGYDAVQAAPKSHRVVFENSFVRVLEVTVPPPGGTIPMHHHRWPSFFLTWDTGGGSPHVRYRRPDGTVRDNPSRSEPVHPGSWSVQWMQPESMHSIEVVENPRVSKPPGSPSDLRIELKCHP